MTQAQRQEIAKMWLALAELHGKTLSRDTLGLMLNSISDLDPELIKSSLIGWLKKPNAKFPMPGDIRLELDPASSVSPRDVANELSRKIQKQIIKRGFSWSEGISHEQGTYYVTDTESYWTFEEAVKATLGDLAWTVINDRGGWRKLVEACNNMEESFFIAQLRDQIESSYRLQKQGVDVTRIALNTAQAAQQIPERVLKLLEQRKEEDQ